MPLAIPSIAQFVADLRSGRRRASDLLEECLARIDELDRVVHAWVRVDAESARAAAHETDLAGDPSTDSRPLLGVPIGIKDIVDVRGLPTLAGSSLRAGHIADRDAEVVRRLRAAGAIILGKTVTTEWACFDPPPTLNPWSLSHTPGGSSSGSAAAVASGMCIAAIGSQTGGSILRPASYCGVAGLKPTFGRVSRAGVLPVSEHLDHVGPIARCVSDLALLLNVIAGYDADDPYSDDEPVIDYTAELAREAPPRLGVIDRETMEALFGASPSEEVDMATEATLARLRSNGAEVVTIVLPELFAEARAMHWRIMAAEASDVHARVFVEYGEQFAPSVAALIEEGLAMSQDEYRQALDHQALLQDEIAEAFGDVDAIVMPTTDTTAPDDLGTTGRPWFQAPWSFIHLPAITIPAALAEDGLPVGLQLVGRAFDEARLLGAAAWCERVIAFEAKPPLVES